VLLSVRAIDGGAEGELDPREHLVQVDHDFSSRDARPNPFADDPAPSFTSAHFYRPVTPIDEPHLLQSEREVRIALELPVIDPGGSTENLDRQPVLGDLAPIGHRGEARRIHEDVRL
jgi:hypothetical protein